MRAVADRAAHIGALDRVATTMEEAFADADVGVLAMPVEAILTTIDYVREWEVRLPQLILDVGSVKTPIVERGRTLDGFVGTHPIAGNEGSGPDAARADLFVDRPWAYAPTSDEERDRRAVAFIETMGARAIGISAVEHDRVLALTSHVPQLLSVLLAACLVRDSHRELIPSLAGPGLESMTRLAHSPYGLWGGIFRQNEENVAAAIETFALLMRSIVGEGGKIDWLALERCFSEGNALASELAQRVQSASPS